MIDALLDKFAVNWACSGKRIKDAAWESFAIFVWASIFIVEIKIINKIADWCLVNHAGSDLNFFKNYQSNTIIWLKKYFYLYFI